MSQRWPEPEPSGIVRGGTHQRFVIGVGETADDMQASGEWLAADVLVDLADWR